MTFVFHQTKPSSAVNKPKQPQGLSWCRTCSLLLYPHISCWQSRKDLDFSFAGLKNSFRMAVTKTVEENDKKTRENKRPGATQVGDRGDGGDAEVHTHIDIIFCDVVWWLSPCFLFPSFTRGG